MTNLALCLPNEKKMAIGIIVDPMQVRVVVENHGLTELALGEHYKDRGAAAAALPAKILDEKRVAVDAVSGATASSNVIKEAVYNALTGKRTIRKEQAN